MVPFDVNAIEAWLAAIFYPFVRILAFLGVAPVLGHRSVPARVKLGLAVLVTALIAPGLDAPTHVIASTPGVLLIAQQVLIGISMGFALRIVLAAIELAGELIGTQMGPNFAGFFDPQSATQGTPLGAWLGTLAILILLSLNGHLVLLSTLADSFQRVPIAPDAIGLQDWRQLVLVGAELFRVGLFVALPVLGAMLIANLAVGVLARVAPQLNVLAVGFPATLLIGLLMLAAALPFIVQFLVATLDRALSLVPLR